MGYALFTPPSGQSLPNILPDTDAVYGNNAIFKCLIIPCMYTKTTHVFTQTNPGISANRYVADIDPSDMQLNTVTVEFGRKSNLMYLYNPAYSEFKMPNSNIKLENYSMFWIPNVISGQRINLCVGNNSSELLLMYNIDCTEDAITFTPTKVSYRQQNSDQSNFGSMKFTVRIPIIIF